MKFLSWGFVAVLALAGCATDQPKPTPLQELIPVIKAQSLWAQRFGKVNFPMTMVANGSALTLAGHDGHIISVQLDTGRELWRTQLNTEFSAGVGSDGRFTSVVSRRNELITLDAGKIIWRQVLPSRVVTAPLVAGDRVFVISLDRSVHAFDALDGRKLWTFQKPGEALVLSQPGVLMAFKDTLLAGQGTKLVALDPVSGSVRWEPSLATPRGTNEIEKLADLVGPAARHGDTVCARAFQAAVTCLNAGVGSVLWSRPIGGTQGIALDGQFVLGADASSRLTSWRSVDASVAWTTQHLLHRGLTAPATASHAKAFIVGDSEGFVHWLARDTGKPLLRLPTDGSPIRLTPVSVGAITVVYTQAGGLFAFRTE
jgi:outer membrane protein assembly factor BamB